MEMAQWEDTGSCMVGSDDGVMMGGTGCFRQFGSGKWSYYLERDRYFFSMMKMCI